MRIGSLRHRLTLQSPSVVRASGRETTTWTDRATVWGAIEPLTSREFWEAKEAQREISAMITIRYRSDITAQWRIKHGAKIYLIDAPPINPDNRNVQLQMMCKLKTDTGRGDPRIENV